MEAVFSQKFRVTPLHANRTPIQVEGILNLVSAVSETYGSVNIESITPTSFYIIYQNQRIMKVEAV